MSIRLHSANHRIISDRLAAGTFLIGGVISGGEVTVRQIIPEHLDAVSYKLAEMGARVSEADKAVVSAADRQLEAVEVQAIAYPGFPTDLQAAFGVPLTQARGTSLVHERVFENRLGYAEELGKMGADIQVSGQTARITGPTKLHGTTVRALDIRCGAALILAALAAEGTTVIEDALPYWPRLRGYRANPHLAGCGGLTAIASIRHPLATDSSVSLHSRRLAP